MRHMPSLAWLTIAAVLAAACSAGEPGDPDTAALSVERDTIGDTVVVRTIAGSIWGDSARLVEELRIGEPDGGDEYGFGHVGYMAVAPSGTIYVYDGAVRALRAYDAEGRYLRTIGGRGEGPGEYREVIGLALLPDGRLLLRDPRLGRVNLYSAEGEPAGAWPLPSGLFTGDMLRTDTAGHVYAKILTASVRELPPGTPWPMGFLRLDTAGAILDTLPAPTWAEETGDAAVYDPTGHWTWHPHGYYVAAFGARYAVDLRRSGGPVLRIERANQPTIPVPPAERSEHDAAFDDLRRRGAMGPNPPPRRPVPAMKPFIRAVATGHDGRIWVRPYMPSVERDEPADTTLPVSRRPGRWTEPVAWDVFEPDGTFLGRLALPPRTTIHAMRGNHVWGTVRDGDDVPYLVRWRIEPDTRGGGEG